MVKVYRDRFSIYKAFCAFDQSLLLIVLCTLLTVSLAFAQQTYNLEVIFKRTNWEPDTIRLYGNALSSAGDVNQDSFDDIVYSVFFNNWYGYGYVFYGGDPMDTVPDLILKCENEGQPLMSIGSGDINGDIISDIIIGEGQAGNWGKVFIFFGGAGIDSLPDLVLNGEPLNAWPFGISVACGEVNGDGFDDLIVGSYDNGDLNGRIYIYYGGPLLDTIPDVVINGHNGESMGITVGSGGDLNSDGYEDIVAGAMNNDEVAWGAGKVYVFFGGNPMDTISDCRLHGEGGAQFLGDCNVDIILSIDTITGRVLTGTPYWPNGYMATNSGKIYILDGGSSLDTIPDWWKSGETDSSFLGTWSTNAGDCELNFFADVLSGAPGMTSLHIGGISYLWLYDSISDTIPDAWFTNGNLLYYLIGCRVASAGDVNGDGYDEVMFSNSAADSNQTVWVCRYAPEGITEQRTGSREQRVRIFPNPFGAEMIIRYSMLDAGYTIKSKLRIRIFDVIGREVISQVSKNEEVGSGKYAEEMIRIDTKQLPAGVYFVAVTEGRQRIIKKAVKVK